MIEIGLVIAIGLVFLLPAAILQGRRRAARRAEAREQQRAHQEAQEQAARAEQQRKEDLWLHHPDRAGLSERLHYQDQQRGQLESDQAEADAYLRQQEDEVKAQAESHGGTERVPVGRRILVLGALVAFPIVFCLSIALDFLIFRGLHPHTFLLPFGLSCLAVLGIMIGSVIFLGAGRHKLVHAPASDYAKLVLRTFGFALAAGVALYMTAIAPYRSAAAGEQAINTAINVLQSVENEQPPPSSPSVLTVDKQAVAQARANLKEAQTVDRLSAALLAFLEIPLTEGAVLGGELLVLDAARRRRDRAQQAVMDVTREINAADAQFVNRLMATLTAKGHDEQEVHRIMARVRNLNAAWGGQMFVPNSLPPGEDPAPGNGQVPDGGSPAGVLGPGDGSVVVPSGGSPVDDSPVGDPGPSPPAVPGKPADRHITNVDPGAGPPGMSPVVRLAEVETDLTG